MKRFSFRSIVIVFAGLLVPMLWGAGLFVDERSWGPTRVEAVDLSTVIGGTACYVDGVIKCPMHDFGCHTACAGKQPGDACAANGYAQQNPNYRKPKPGVGGKKSTARITPAKLCGYIHGCGPKCVMALGGTGCPFGTVADYEVEKKPAGESCSAG